MLFIKIFRRSSIKTKRIILFRNLCHCREILRAKRRAQDDVPGELQKKNCTKRLAAISKLIFDIIPNDPTLPIYRQGNALGANYTHWFRAKFFQQYRLFFRYHLESKIIIYAWINDEDTKRAYDSKIDAYLVFTKMLNIGRPPDDWEELLAESKSYGAQEKFCKISIKPQHD
jgi:toxin YhaV